MHEDFAVPLKIAAEKSVPAVKQLRRKSAAYSRQNASKTFPANARDCTRNPCRLGRQNEINLANPLLRKVSLNAANPRLEQTSY